MNKLHMLALVGLMLCASNKASIMGQEQREVLYTLHTLGQKFINVPMITQNIDMFMGVLEMNIQVNEAKLKDAEKKLKTTLWNSCAICLGTVATRAVAMDILKPMAITHFVREFLMHSVFSPTGIVHFAVATNIYNAWKNRSELMEAMILDKEILGKLEEIKDSMSFIEENTDSAENCLLNSAE
jgi:hypothetical protein